jgi:hypothetical protein
VEGEGWCSFCAGIETSAPAAAARARARFGGSAAGVGICGWIGVGSVGDIGIDEYCGLEVVSILSLLL